MRDLVDWRCNFGFGWEHFAGAAVLDVGVWTGATSYALAALRPGELVAVAFAGIRDEGAASQSRWAWARSRCQPTTD